MLEKRQNASIQLESFAPDAVRNKWGDWRREGFGGIKGINQLHERSCALDTNRAECFQKVLVIDLLKAL